MAAWRIKVEHDPAKGKPLFTITRGPTRHPDDQRLRSSSTRVRHFALQRTAFITAAVDTHASADDL
jgi:hypothetical protein